jgi:hypothetical protein
MGIMNGVFKPTSVLKYTRIHLYKTLACPVLCYRSEAWAISKGNSNRLTANKMKFMRKAVGYVKWDRKRNEVMLMVLNIEPITDYIKHYQENWRSHVITMTIGRYPKAILQYQPQGKRSVGHLMKGWREIPRLQQASGPNTCQEEDIFRRSWVQILA